MIAKLVCKNLIPGLCLLLGIAGCESRQAPSAAVATPDDAARNTSDAPAGDCVANAFFKGRVSGAVQAELDVDRRRLSCEGGPRPDGEGARLYFAIADERSAGLAVIVALPELRRGQGGEELAANVTLILEGEARFFSTQNQQTCWADIAAGEHLGGARYVTQGRLYCIAPLAEVGGMDSVSVGETEFRGVIDWGES
ncbi:MAG: hypothetical protein AAFX56_13045 [Pseudomonadota bacterium]